MKLTRRDLMWKWLAYGLSLALVTVINYCVLNQLPLGAIPVLLPVTAVAVGVLEGPKSGAGYGMAAGIVMAAATHGSMAWVFLLCVLGWICGLLALYVLRRDFVGYLPGLLGGGAAVRSGTGTSPIGVRRRRTAVLLRVAGLEYLWTAAFAIPGVWPVPPVLSEMREDLS